MLILKVRCLNCNHVAPMAHYRYGEGREYGRHEEHRYCPSCGRSIDWYGWRYASETPEIAAGVSAKAS